MIKDQEEPDRSEVDARERDLAQREARVEAEETRRAERQKDVDAILSDAARRDERAAARDVAAGNRDMAANMQAWLHDDEDRADAEARQEALDDRLHSAADRESSAADRSALAEKDDDAGT